MCVVAFKVAFAVRVVAFELMFAVYVVAFEVVFAVCVVAFDMLLKEDITVVAGCGVSVLSVFVER